MPDNQLIGKWCKCFFGKFHSVYFVASHSYCIAYIQITIVIIYLFVILITNIQTTHCLVRHFIPHLWKNLRCRHVLRFFVLSFKNQPAHFRQSRFCFFIIVLVRRARRHCFFVQLYLFQLRVTEHHCCNPSITNRECFFPIRSGFVIPYSIDVLSFHIPQQRRKSQHTTEYFTYHFHILKF